MGGEWAQVTNAGGEGGSGGSTSPPHLTTGTDPLILPSGHPPPRLDRVEQKVPTYPTPNGQ